MLRATQMTNLLANSQEVTDLFQDSLYRDFFNDKLRLDSYLAPTAA